MNARCPLPYDRVRAGIARANDLQFYREPEPRDDPYEPTDACRKAVARVKAARAVYVPLWARWFKKAYIRRQLRKEGL